MSAYFIYYTEASIVCMIIFGIMLCRDIFNADRQEKQIKYDHALIAFMLYMLFRPYKEATTLERKVAVR